MQTTIPTRATISWGPRLMPAAIALGLALVLVFGFGRRAAAQFAAAGDPPLAFGDNFFVTGDYVIAGAYGMTSHLQQGFATGTISFPDTANQGISGPTSVPEGAQIVAALLYWQTAEKLGQPGTGQKGFFRPVFSGGPSSGYPITGVDLTNHSTVSFSSGGCSGTSTGKVLRTYRAEVRAFLPQDTNGNVIINSTNNNPTFKNLTFEVRLPSVGSNTPLTLGATLVLIYRVLDPSVPLNSIVLYDGAFASTSNSQVMAQTLQGMYDASTGPGSKASVAWVVGSGQGNKFQDVYFNGTDNNHKLSSLYGKSPDFPGWYGTWDNVRWNFAPNTLAAGQASVLTQVVPSTTMPAGCVSAAAIIVSTTVENTDQDGLLNSWKSNGGYCDASFNEAGTLTNSGRCTQAGSQWVNLPNAHTPGSGKDVYVQLDYMCYSKTGADSCDTRSSIAKQLSAVANAAPDGTTTYTGSFADNTFPLNTFVNISGFQTQDVNGNFVNNGNFIVVSNAANQLVVNNANGVAEAHAGTATFTDYAFDPRLVTDSFTGLNSFDEVNAAYASKGITLHAEWHAMQEPPGCVDILVSGVWSYCAYLNQPGLVSWKGQFDILKSQPLDPNTTEAQCQASPATCVRRFQHGRKDSYHEVIFAHAQGGPEWSFQAGTLSTGALCPAGTACVAQVGQTVTFYTSTSNGLGAGSTNDLNPLHRVTISDSITKTMLSGTYQVLSATDKSFTIHVPFSANATYTPLTDPRLSVTSGRIHSRSGFSDIGGADSLVTLGRWDPLVVPQVTGSTFMHEFGHANGLTHSGYFYDGRALNPNDYRPTVEANCKPNFQSVMNYPFQLNLLDTGTHKVVDYSEEQLDTLDEQNLGRGVSISGNTPVYPNTLWYAPTPPTVNTSRAKFTCDGFPVPDGTNGYLASGSADLIPAPGWNTIQDINFNLTTNLPVDRQMRGHSDWTNSNALVSGLVLSPGMDLRQVGATGADAAGSGGSLGAGGGSLGAGGGSLGAGGGSLGAGGGSLGAGGGSLGAGGGSLGAGGGSLGAGGGVGEIDFATATGVTYPPSDLTATEGALDQNGVPQPSPRTITLKWTPGFGLIGAYKIYRSPDANGQQQFGVIATVTGNPPATTYTDNPACNLAGYQYFVTAVQSGSSPNPGQESGPSNTVSKGQSNQPLTGCYLVSNFTPSPTSAVQGRGSVQITWILTDASNTAGQAVTRQAANTLVAIGPVPNTCAPGRTTLLTDGVRTSGVDAFTNNNNQFTFTWNNTDAFCAGSYSFELDLDHVTGGPAQVQLAAASLQLGIDVTDTDNPQIMTTALPDATVGVLYGKALNEDGGVGAITWSVSSGSLPTGIVLNSATGTLSGTATVPAPGVLNFTAQVYTFTVQAMDSQGNKGTQTLTLRLITAVSLSRADYSTGAGPIGLIAADFNGDRKLDLASANSGDNTVSILLSNGNGTFTAQTTLATGSVPYSLTAGDFNGDEKLDLAVTNFANGAASTVSIFIGNGDGTFAAGVTYAVGSGPISVVTGDFNGDGKLDLAVANQNDHSVSILLGNGDGTFQAHADYPAGTTDVAAVAFGDFNGDGKLDLAVTNPSSDTVSILLGNGDGTFQGPAAYSTGAPVTGGNHPVAVAAADFNGDGKLDLAVTNLNTRNVAIFLGNGDGTFQTQVSYSTTNGAMIGPSAITTGDFNGDGLLDLAVTDQHDNSVTILLGNGNGMFQSPLEFTTGNFAAGVAAGDFNGDGRLDLAVADLTDNKVSVMLHLPQPPTNLVVSGVTTGQVGLSWTSSLSTGIAGYNVYRGTTTGGPYTQINLAVVTASGFTDMTVVSGNTYYFVVTAVDPSTLESVNSNEVSATAQ